MRPRTPSTALAAPGLGVTRIAVLSDAHVGGQGLASWHNELHYDDAPALLATAVQVARTNHASLLVALGDLTDRGDASSLRKVHASLAEFPGAVRVVAGNHDRAVDNAAFEAEFDDQDSNVEVARTSVEDWGAFGLSGLYVESFDRGLTCRGHVGAIEDWPEGLTVLMSHYPILDVSKQLGAAGVRNAGTLSNFEPLVGAIAARTGPTLVLSGHLHARVEHMDGCVLQLSVGALVEHPHEVTLVDITQDSDSVAIQARRLPLLPADGGRVGAAPVLGQSATRWVWDGRQWSRGPQRDERRPLLCLDWNGTVVDDDERAHRASVVVLSELGLASEGLATHADFRREFTLPLASYFHSIGVPESTLGRAVARWNELMLTADPPQLNPGARDLLRWAMRQGLDIHVVSGADPLIATTDLRVLLPEIRVTSVVGHAHPKSTVLDQLSWTGPVVFVGDTRYDITEGLRSGAVTVGFASDRSQASLLADAGADFVVSDLTGVQEIISREYS